MDYFTSDTHFGQERTFKYSKRDRYAKTVEDMDELMIQRWNNVVKPEDTVYHLGDFGDYNVAERLNGNIILLFGNYERRQDPDNAFKYKDLFTYIEADTFIFLLEYKLILVHEPSHILEARYRLGLDNDQFYLFGHIHEKQKVKRHGLNVGVDVCDFKPVDLEYINFYRKAIQDGVYDDEVFNNF